MLRTKRKPCVRLYKLQRNKDVSLAGSGSTERGERIFHQPHRVHFIFILILKLMRDFPCFGVVLDHF